MIRLKVHKYFLGGNKMKSISESKIKYTFLLTIIILIATPMAYEIILFYRSFSKPYFPIFNLDSAYRLDKNLLRQQNLQHALLDPQIGFRFQPNKDVFGFRADSDGNLIFDTRPIARTDNQGFVNPSGQRAILDYRKLAKDSDLYKILVLGKSSALPFGIKNASSSWVNRLYSKLKIENKNIVLINTAVPAATLPLNLTRYINETSYLYPNLMIYFDTDYNAFDEIVSPLDYAGSFFYADFLKKLNPELARQERHLFPYIYDKFKGQMQFNNPLFSYKAFDYIYEKKIKLWHDRYLILHAIAKIKNTKLIYILGPSLGSCSSKLNEFQKQMSDKFYSHDAYKRNPFHQRPERANIIAKMKSKLLSESHSYDFSCIFDDEPRAYTDPMHFSEFGHAVIADAIYSIIKNLNK